MKERYEWDEEKQDYVLVSVTANTPSPARQAPCGKVPAVKPFDYEKDWEDYQESQRQIWLQVGREDRAEALFEKGWTLGMVLGTIKGLDRETANEIKDAVKERKRMRGEK